MKISKYLLPLLTVVALVGGYWLRLAFTQPTTSVEFDMVDAAAVSQVVCTVDGVKCKGTANFFTGLFDGVEGVKGIETIASEHRASISYDPKLITPARIKEIIEQEISLQDGTKRQVFRCLDMKKI